MLTKFGMLVCDSRLFPKLPLGLDKVTSFDNGFTQTALNKRFREAIGPRFYTESLFVRRDGSKLCYGLILIRKASSQCEFDPTGMEPYVSDEEFRVTRRDALALFSEEPKGVVIPFRKVS